MECLLDVVQSKKINKYEETAISLAAYHEDHPNTLESLQSLFKVCQEVSGDLPTEENKEKERKELVEVNLKALF